MDLAQYVDRLHHELMVAAAAGGDDARALAERLTAPLESAARLTILAALSSAASEITRELAPGSVDVRLRGLDPEFVVTPAPVPEPRDEVDDEGPGNPPPPALPGPGDAEEGGTARMTLRLPEQFKVRIEEAASREALPVNTWLVRTLATALEQGDRGRRPRRHDPSSDQQRYTGWVQ
jgi:hypothetical protein